MSQEKYDLIVIGSGPAGFSAATRAIDFKKSVCIIEANHLGGAGIMNGALSSKAMWELSKDFNVASSVNRGYRVSGLLADYKQVQKTIIQAAKQKQLQMLSQIETFSEKTETHGSICLKYGWAKFIDSNTIQIDKKGEKEIITGDNIIIATGSRPREMPDIEIDQERIINSEGIMKLKEFPERMIIIGSGIIGCEYATIFSNYNQTEVHLLDRQHKVIPYEDDDISDFVSKGLEKNGVIIHHTANLRTIRKKSDCLEVVLDYQDGHSTVIEVDVAIVAIGRIPNLDNLGLENVNIKTTERGYLNINEICAIDNFQSCNIFAAGDVSGHAQLYSVGEIQGRSIVEALYGNLEFPLDYSNMSTLMFFKPEVAAVGMNEKACKKQNIPYKVASYSNELVNRAIAMRATDGFIKIIVSDDGENRILGMRAAGPQASTLITSIAYQITQKGTLKDIRKNVHPHPSISEGVQECLRVFEGKSIYKPQAFPDLIKLKSWKPGIN
ncbi:NAD(P)/FAD-dependent oxidoreductase [Ancylomarina sp. 16SWW S1-10-2]|uniref:dihydrolipoyl dehydrogenase family protein n=1 Tax=Ancylomarina sp. 16SWW S1-10-2 TaxID=2499681 RepID=UPI0012AE1312|nr:NAD(P)/FAD-dependent oxidoreductase [Ancylomarina sp. 16SWW S1-10-2]MRT93364.1 NAD(P)/FAD-dependent oxidoreductase [Ancylomarina sp. 16SWW S1-10-2]